MTKYCPYCREEISSLNYNASYSETVYGTSYGTCDLEGEDTEFIDQDSNNSDGFNETDFEYRCPECDRYVDLNELLDKLEEEEEEEEEEDINDYNLKELKKV